MALNAEDRQSGSFDVGRLGAGQRRRGLVGGGVGLSVLQHGQDTRFDKLGNLHRVARCGGNGMLDAVSQCTHVFAFSPVDRRGCGRIKL
jgi:hypothetical protein